MESGGFLPGQIPEARCKGRAVTFDEQVEEDEVHAVNVSFVIAADSPRARLRTARAGGAGSAGVPRGLRTAIVSTYPPRACGIGTFAADLRATLLGVDGVERADLVAVVNEPSSPQRRGLLATIAQAVRGDYVRTARMLGRLDVDVVLLQHEYGIFGGRDGEYVLSFAQELAQPLVVTLHTVLSEPTPHQARGARRSCARRRSS